MHGCTRTCMHTHTYTVAAVFTNYKKGTIYCQETGGGPALIEKLRQGQAWLCSWTHYDPKLQWLPEEKFRKALQQVIKTTQNITGTIYRASVTSVKWDVCTEPEDTSRQHPPSHSLIPLLPSDMRYRYLLPYHQTTEQLHSPSCETPELINAHQH